MYSYTADELFDGYRFLPKKSSVEVSEQGTILSLNNPQSFQKIHCEGLLMPGIINAHCHLELSYLKTKIPQSTGLISFLMNVVKQRNLFTDNEISSAIQEAEQDMLNNGIVAIGDICNGLSTLAVKCKNKLHYHSFVECFGLNEEKVPDIISHAVGIRNEFAKYHSSSLALHAPYSISDKLIQVIDDLWDGKCSTIHNQESNEENRLFVEGKGSFVNFIEHFTQQPFSKSPSQLSSVQTYLPKLKQTNKLILVHNTYTSEEDIQFIKNQSKDIYFCLCPKANLYIQGATSNALLFYKNNCQIVIGTDSLASNSSLNILEEVIVLHEHFPSIPMESLLHSATLQGAKALGFEKLLGSFEVNKKPGFVQVMNWKENSTEVNVLHSA